MRCSLLRWWLGTSIVTCVLTCGCQHCRQCCPTCCSAAAPAASGPAAPAVSSYAPTTFSVPPNPVNAVVSAANEVPAVYTTGKPASLDAGTRPQADPHIVRGEGEFTPSTTDSFRGGSTPRRTFTDLTAHPGFGHDSNYHWLVGTLDYSKIQGAWVLRYASVEDEDRYGGSVTLACTERMNAFKSGQLVRVEGHLIDPDSRQIRPAFQVQTIRPVQP